MKLKIFTIAALSLVTQLSFAGDNGGGALSCVSDSGKTILKGGAGTENYNGSGPSSLVLTIEGKSAKLAASEVPSKNIMVDFVTLKNNSEYSVAIKKITSMRFEPDTQEILFQELVLKLDSVPGTFKKAAQDNYKFQAILSKKTRDPRVIDAYGSSPELKSDIRLNCNLDLSI